MYLVTLLSSWQTLARANSYQGKIIKVFWMTIFVSCYENISVNSYVILINWLHFIPGNALNVIKKTKLQEKYSESGFSHKNGGLTERIERLFNTPFRASPTAAKSKECIECRRRGKNCLLVKYTFFYLDTI